VALSTQKQALCAQVFLYKQVLGGELGDFGQRERAKKPKRLPTVMSTQEAARVLAAMTWTGCQPQIDLAFQRESILH
jgi:hypothetical protein